MRSATIVITTRNRRDELGAAIASALEQRGPVDVLVIDDGSTDDTTEMVKRDYPSVRLVRYETSAGLIARRNDAASLVTAPIIVSIDDDAVFSSPDVVERTLADFDDPRIGVVAIPYIDVGRGESHVRQASPDTDRIHLAAPYRGTAHALRLDIFRAAGGYRSEFVRQCEELDYGLRMLAVGHVVRLGTAPPVLHHESARRSTAQIAYYDTRNNLLHALWNVPWPFLPARVAKVALYALTRVAPGTRHPLAVVRGILAGFVFGGANLRAKRRPVSRAVYRLDHEIRFNPGIPLSDVADRLPPSPYGSVPALQA